MKNTNTLIASLAAALLLTIGSTAQAQPAPERGMGPGPGMGPGYGMAQGQGRGMGQRMGGMHGQRGMMGRNPAAMVEARLAYLKTDLKITAQQETAWQTFATKSRKLAETRQAKRSKMQEAAAAPMTAPERLAKRTEFMKQQISEMESMTAAVSELYAALTPEQKAIADKSLGMMGGFRGGKARQMK